MGIDLADAERLDAALQRRRALADRLFTADEGRLIDSGDLHPAAAFALKEAVMKSLGVGLARVSFTDISVGTHPARVSELTGRAAERAARMGVRGFEAAVDRHGSLFRATVVALGDTRAQPPGVTTPN